MQGWKTPQLLHKMLVTVHWLTEHGFEPNQAADEAVEVDVHVLVGVAHGDDVVQLVVETEAWAGHTTHDCTVTRTFRGWVQAVGSSAAHTELKPTAFNQTCEVCTKFLKTNKTVSVL